MQRFIMCVVLTGALAVSVGGCSRETVVEPVVDTAERVADEVTGSRVIRQGIAAEEQIRQIEQQHNQQLGDALAE